MISSRHIWLWHCLHTFSPCSKYSKTKKKKNVANQKKWMSSIFPFGLCFFPDIIVHCAVGGALATHSPKKLLQQTSITVCLSFSKCDCFVGDKCEIVALKG